MSKPVALVTGASSGIGLELARLLAADRRDLVLVARGRERLDALARELATQHGISALVLTADLANPSEPQRVLREVEARQLEIEILVNDAGFGQGGFFAEMPLESALEMIQVNVVALTVLAHGALKGMVARRRGRILNVASTAGFQPGPLMAIYYATKAYVLSFSEAIANEAGGTGVTVTTLCPGPTSTAFHERAGVGATRLFRSPLVLDAHTVARAGYRGMMKGKGIVIPGFGNRLLVEAQRLTPRRLVTAISRKLQESR
jgi:short-subunit dehydrogenase